MIPTIEEIIAGVSTRQFTQLQAVKWLYQHIETSTDNDGLRDHFAGLAMAIMWDAYDKGYCGLNDKDMPNDTVIARGAYQIADAMLKERSK
jgi:hypothetical protein